MRILVAEDSDGFRLSLQTVLTEWGYDVESVSDGAAAWEVLRHPDGPPLALLDWMMPEVNGLDLCARVRRERAEQPPYLVLLTGRSGTADVVAGLEGGADDYLTKPVDFHELRARIETGRRIVTLQQRLAQRVAELEEALGQVRQLQGLLPICCYCKKIRDDRNYWQQVETYISRHAGVQFSHGICPDCMERIVKPEIARIQAGASASPKTEPS
jgi:CheY-like chemotaxis protein